MTTQEIKILSTIFRNYDEPASKERLEREINSYMASGWKMQGTLAVTLITDHSHIIGYMHQTMIRDKLPVDKKSKSRRDESLTFASESEQRKSIVSDPV